MIHKWLHYFPIYERHLEPFRGRPVKVLEIGVSHGGSLQMWRHYLGRKATVIGVDIEPRVTELREKGIELEVGDQSDPIFLAELAERHGPFDVVIDDGSHQPAHQIASLVNLWPHLAEHGVYIVEDLHTNYWPEYGAARGAPHTFISWVQARIDDMNAFHSREPNFEITSWTETLTDLHVYDSVVVLGKAQRVRPEHRKTGRPYFNDIYGRDANELIDENHRAQLASLGTLPARLRRACRDPLRALRRAADRITRPG